MCSKIRSRCSRPAVATGIVVGAAFLIMQLVVAPAVNAVEELSAKELSSHCVLLERHPAGADALYCIRYIQGFIDGAVATDARVMLSAESGFAGKETFSERAKRTRLPSRMDRFRATTPAGFCLGDPLPLRNVVGVIVADLAAMTEEEEQSALAMDVVYASLQRHYPCEQ